MKGLVTKSTGSWYTVRVDEDTFEARLRGKFKLIDNKITNPITVGDRVEIERIDDDYVIVALEDRQNYVVRNSPRKKGHSHLLAANIDQAIVIASLKMPRTSLGFIDRFLVTLEAFRIPGYIIFNKSDLYDSEEKTKVDDILRMYERIGYQGILTSFHNETHPQIVSWLEGKMTLLAGHSGTGKSTFINRLYPDVAQTVGEVSAFAKKGIHTTTFAEMFSDGGNTYIIDTPGIKELGLAEIEEDELSHYFPEMREFLGSCKFNNCLHLNEPGCVIVDAVEKGTIDVRRYYSYLSMLEGDDNRR